MFQDVAEFCDGLVREDFYMHQIEALTHDQCGSELARESAVSINIIAE
ncbi:hypothetical protein [Pseudomonas sp. McL0111]